MRLSNNQKFLIHFFLITSLTFLLKPSANAQAVPTAVFAYNDYWHNRPLLNEPEDDVNKHDEAPTDVQVLPTINFHHMMENLCLKPLAYQAIKNNGKICHVHNITLIRVYSVDLKRSARLTFKLFKLVIVPLWQSK